MSGGAPTSIGDILALLDEAETPRQSVLLADLPFALQGLQTESLRWHRDALLLPQTMSYSTVEILHRLSEPAVIYRWLNNAISAPAGGLISQALYNTVAEELQKYLVLVGDLEKRLRQNTLDLTLPACIALIQDATSGLRLLYSIVSRALQRPAHEVLSLVYSYTLHGDKFVAAFSERIYKNAREPFDHMLNQWILSGTLNDPYGELFVTLADPEARWGHRFLFSKDKVPRFMPVHDAVRFFDIGKSLYFLYDLCGDSEYVLERTATKNQLDKTKLQDLVNKNYQDVILHVKDLLDKKFRLPIHLLALKKYLLLCSGDFTQELVADAFKRLNRPAAELYRQDLVAILETAISTSNAQFEDESVISKVDARMLELGHGEEGWQVFTLEYRLDSPLDVVINQQATRKYLQIFNMMWRLRWVNYALVRTWKRVTVSQRGDLGLALREQGLEDMWRLCSESCQVMMEFVNELLLYIYTEVIDRAWDTMLVRLQREPPTVDKIIEIHGDYLDTIVHRALFGKRDVVGILHDLVKHGLSFSVVAEDFYFIAVQRQVASEAERFARLASKIENLKREFTREVRQLVAELDKIDDDSRSFATRLDFNRYYKNTAEAPGRV